MVLRALENGGKVKRVEVAGVGFSVSVCRLSSGAISSSYSSRVSIEFKKGREE